MPVNNFLEKFEADLSPPLKEALSTVWLLSNELPADAFRRDDFEIFHAASWAALRSAASEALRWLGWESLKPQIALMSALIKSGFLLDETGAGAVDKMRCIKWALDPKNILNPGKNFAM